MPHRYFLTSKYSHTRRDETCHTARPSKQNTKENEAFVRYLHSVGEVVMGQAALLPKLFVDVIIIAFDT